MNLNKEEFHLTLTRQVRSFFNNNGRDETSFLIVSFEEKDLHNIELLTSGKQQKVIEVVNLLSKGLTMYKEGEDMTPVMKKIKDAQKDVALAKEAMKIAPPELFDNDVVLDVGLNLNRINNKLEELLQLVAKDEFQMSVDYKTTSEIAAKNKK